MREFSHAGIRFQIIKLPVRRRLQLWLKWGEQPWEFGHGKDVPEGMSFETAANYMREFITGDLDHGTYNRLLPEA
ncbi:hypothetical protein SEA_FRED313_75 [Mycobacterium phage Fred313]|uniref:Uncharacterized protein n=1 Tax=Mycobacterium phage Fred313 TaxID=2015809 RepID=A0A286MQ08_9CAUD|nr:hypothetical protein SEA_FRED313_75 [Mycobacterium phage Fred313]AVR57060.1 hypothetical protein PBI_PUPPY_78 [Mycobacterium phage Puppy]